MSNGDLFSSSFGPGVERSVRLGAAVWILAIQFFIAQFVVQSAWTTPFSLTKNYISDLGSYFLRNGQRLGYAIAGR